MKTFYYTITAEHVAMSFNQRMCSPKSKIPCRHADCRQSESKPNRQFIIACASFISVKVTKFTSHNVIFVCIFNHILAKNVFNRNTKQAAVRAASLTKYTTEYISVTNVCAIITKVDSVLAVLLYILVFMYIHYYLIINLVF